MLSGNNGVAAKPGTDWAVPRRKAYETTKQIGNNCSSYCARREVPVFTTLLPWTCGQDVWHSEGPSTHCTSTGYV